MPKLHLANFPPIFAVWVRDYATLFYLCESECEGLICLLILPQAIDCILSRGTKCVVITSTEVDPSSNKLVLIAKNKDGNSLACMPSCLQALCLLVSKLCAFLSPSSVPSCLQALCHLVSKLCAFLPPGSIPSCPRLYSLLTPGSIPS